MVTSNDRPFGTAVVVGGSIGGCSVAAALAPHFHEVVVVDRDELPDTPRTRKGVPHGYQFHVVTVGALRALEELFPGMTEELRAAGVPYSDPGTQTRYGSKFGWLKQAPSGVMYLQPTRRLVEWYVRKRAADLTNVTFVPQTRVTGLRVSDGAVRGVDTVNVESGESRPFEADFVVDVSGRASQAPSWLKAAGYSQPVETTVNAHWGYATTYVTVPEGWDPGYRVLYITPTLSGEGPSATRGAAMWLQENNQWVVTAQACAGDYPPGDLEGFKAYMATVDAPDFLDLLNEFGTSGPVSAWRNTTNRMRDYANLAQRPDGFVVIGDAVAAFNPAYGQGIAVAATGACMLGHAIGERRDSNDLLGFAADFQKRLSVPLQQAWGFSTKSDFEVPGVEVDGRVREFVKTPESEYFNRVVALATEDDSVAAKLWQTIQFVRDLEWIADEELRAKVLADWDRLGEMKRGKIS